ncbi:hypothetical protein LP419_40270 [Massilia sp. H-1]|nr:hypothetical protein LP419_40270 [Massilia sp. H-1]
MQVDNDDLQSLARRRSQAAKDWLTKTGQVPDDRIYIVASHDTEGASKDGKAPTARVDFALR